MNRSRILAVLAVLALLVVGAAGTASAAKLITGKSIKNNSITGKDVKKGSLQVSDLSKKAVAELKGAQGPAGPAVLPKAYAAQVDSNALGANTPEDVLIENVPAGTYVVNAKLVLFQANADNGDCFLAAGATSLDSASVIPANASARTPIALQGVVTLAAPGQLRVNCAVDANVGTALDVKITAIAVSEVG